MASTLLTLAEVREHLETDLSDEALERLVDAADYDIIAVAGPHDGARTVELNGNSCELLMPWPVFSIASVEESYHFSDYETVSADDYSLAYNGRVLIHKTGWKPRVKVEYTPQATNAKRVTALLQLVALLIEYSPFSNQSDGVYSQSRLTYASERNRMLNSVRQQYGGVM